ncbi:PREDICTED: uncharacterized protein LOC109586702 isoform X2 [Amphimedon queenslandica]|uniref:Uncharacterized protein n=1 Tax=Amphimedon queenslandica TaxID=400682 RepID=A0AAN0JNV6_AMPQE|nr:PREDICTED: uncharacterized protein LOC109586702 isoform X2 [Amphimedon queenslandica]|eukprot:XP_019858468.1 PREDICTED: uncharacterized protein LOC109586702 isoform X2 [Amphimedon queenslandica]
MMKTIERFLSGLHIVAVLVAILGIIFNYWSVLAAIFILELACLNLGKIVRRKPKKQKALDRCGREYHSMCKAQKHLSNEAEYYKKENKKLKLEKKRWEEFQVILTDKLDKSKEQFQSELEKKDRHIVHLTRRIAKLESAETAWKVKLDFEKDKVRGLKREVGVKLEEISDLERMKEDDLTSFNERLSTVQAEFEAAAKHLLVAEELNHQLCAQLQIEKVPIFKKDLPLIPVCARSPSNIYYSLNNNTSDLSNGYGLNIGDVPPSFADVKYMDIVAENYKLQDIQNIVASDSIDKTDYYDRCRLSSDPLEKIPSSLHSIWIGARHVT